MLHKCIIKKKINKLKSSLKIIETKLESPFKNSMYAMLDKSITSTPPEKFMPANIPKIIAPIVIKIRKKK